ncbi:MULTISPECIES: SCO family protein [Exiguobacterium]|jgi:protein SCO1/2|uniref:SCO family protein n=1 Tax=Exiguobacterium TaxID=33986 RepID=UPI001BE7B691|nr:MULTISPECIES: SCO family protein [Exiguobacterium]MCT4777551.1 SCO family protein [Exiguobacterium aquaticum]MCT4788742.1 SCO family protein [Exiguobacterium mexicanum]
MERVKKWMLIGLISLMAVLAACGQEIEDPLNWEIESFDYMNQEGEQVSLDDLKGKVWMADFVFTSCETVCPPMTYNMTKLNEALVEEGVEDVQFVSFSVDPTVDTPDKIQAFMSDYDLAQADWQFLTGYSQEEIEAFAQQNFKALVRKPSEGTQVDHATWFYLVDQDGKIIKAYQGFQDVPIEDIVSDIKILQES